jgi:lipid-binding SYLF domain-containing protein
VKRLFFFLALAAAAQEFNPDQRLEHATAALRDFLNSDSPIPKDLVAKAQCVIVAPGLMKGAFLVGGKYGRGFAACRKASGGWTPPAAIAIEGGNFSSADLILLVMNAAGMERLMGEKFEAAVAAGPLNGSAGPDAEMLAYSRSKGVFAGISLEGATLRADAGENKKLFGKETSNRDVLSGKVLPPRGAKPFVALLVKHARPAKR